MAFPPPALPYVRTALEPHISGETLDIQLEHQREVVARLNRLVAGGPFEGLGLEDIVRRAQGSIAQSAAQAWAGTLCWNSLRPLAAGDGEPRGKLAAALSATAGSGSDLRARFDQAALHGPASGWAWLLQRPDGRLAVAATPPAVTPLTGPDRALLACSLWEDAGGTEGGSARAKYLEAFWTLVDWDAAAARMA